MLGKTTMVYQDPFTKEKPEGLATISRVLVLRKDDLGPGLNSSDCMVRFLDDIDAAAYRRTLAAAGAGPLQRETSASSRAAWAGCSDARFRDSSPS